MPKIDISAKQLRVTIQALDFYISRPSRFLVNEEGREVHRLMENARELLMEVENPGYHAARLKLLPFVKTPSP